MTANENGWRRKSDIDILHAAKHIIQCEIALNHEVDKLLALIGLTRAEVVGRKDNGRKEDSSGTPTAYNNICIPILWHILLSGIKHSRDTKGA